MIETDAEIDQLLHNISCMSFGEEFYITENELYDLAISLLRPIKLNGD